MKIAYITSGAANMFCGSCLRDNALAAALGKLGHDALLIPTYTPIRTDEENVSSGRVFFGGINVYLQQKSALFRHTPWLFDRLFDFPRLLRWVSRFAISTRADKLADLTLSIIQGEAGHQAKEIEKLLAFLRDHVHPEVLILTNVLQSGMAPRLKQSLKIPLIATLQGDDVFLETLPASHRERAIQLIGENCRVFDGFIATSRYYADFMAGYLGIPREKIHVIWPGINLHGHGPREKPPGPFTIGFFARICPEKGLHRLADAFRILHEDPTLPPCRLRIAGWLGGPNVAYFDEQMAMLKKAGLGDKVERVDCPDHASKVKFLQSLDVLSVPTVYREPKGLYLLEAWANGIPVVQPAHGSFPELIEETGAGVLVPPDDPRALAKGLRDLMNRTADAREMGQRGQRQVQEKFTAQIMAERTVEVLRKHVKA